MPEETSTNLPKSLSHFLIQSDLDYKNSLSSIPLFDVKRTIFWDDNLRKMFASIFYHLRGHFINFLWYVANFADNEASKQIIIQNIYEEIGIGNRFSHEKLYERFAKECGVDIHDEIVNETNYIPFAKEFNKAHLSWLAQHDPKDHLCAFAAYERLDNLDYPFLVELAKSMKISQHGMTFFNVHTHVDHFDTTLQLIVPIWEESPQRLIESFHFIQTHQLGMWEQFSNILFN
ncbi:iron-containing redox enzyme family protein [Legionella pneumophila]|nr:iron-containing redox enzyme family protein [Legionella pneumophila]HAT4423214.1 iron-containing redox enzyme family protein [Legionella pneumophila]HAU1719630.1 iron-containing redox enzyme family protein [Legionella pneumophila]